MSQAIPPQSQPFPHLSTPVTTVNSDTHRVFNIGSYLLSIYGSFTLLFHHHSHNGGDFQNDETPFSSNIIIVLTYWGLLYILQLGYLYQFETNLVNSLALNSHFVIFNIAHFIWTLFYKKSWYFLSEVVILINLLNLLIVYFNHQTYKFKITDGAWNWFFIHLPVSVFPLTWLLYAVFWNGAILFGIHEFIGRLISNILIWDFLIVPILFLILFNDWAIGLTSAYLTFGIGLGQLFTKLFALQWIFAFVISGILFILSILIAVTGGLPPQQAPPSQILQGDQAPLLS
ncbi:hypothetical protein DFJ63DRAFT_313049 [Scheffersomyces coipomensis]|uniref:uncharacterized protein n=1 Tax=Scheffersomyces coipomensis TaxID=1788519 RepID=UPI00315D89B3